MNENCDLSLFYLSLESENTSKTKTRFFSHPTCHRTDFKARRIHSHGKIFTGPQLTGS